MNEFEKRIHENTILSARNLKIAEGKLIENLHLVKEHQVFKKLGYTSLHVYAVEELGLSSDGAYQYTRVADKAREIPELKQAIDEGTLTVSTVRRILTVITPETKTEWIEKAISLPQKELEREVVIHNPRELVRERLKPLTEHLTGLHCTIPKELEQMIERIRDLESQRMRRPVDLVASLTAACKVYLEKNDPVLKAKRNLGKPIPRSNSVARQIPAQVKHAVNHRDQGQCVYVDAKGRRCPNRRWVELHHKQPYSQGGSHTTDNLVTLCRNHHSLKHAPCSG